MTITTYYQQYNGDEDRTNSELVALAESLFPFLPGDGWKWLPSFSDWYINIVAPGGLQFSISKESSWKVAANTKLWISQSAQRWEDYQPSGSGSYQPNLKKIGCSSTKGAEKIAKDIINRFLADAREVMVEEIRLIEAEIARRNDRDIIVDSFVALGGRKGWRDENEVSGEKWQISVSGGKVKVSTSYHDLTPEQARQVVTLLNTF